MARTIEFNHETERAATKINDVHTQDVLTTKSRVTELATPQE